MYYTKGCSFSDIYVREKKARKSNHRAKYSFLVISKLLARIQVWKMNVLANTEYCTRAENRAIQTIYNCALCCAQPKFRLRRMQCK